MSDNTQTHSQTSFIDAVNLIASTTVLGVLYGITLALYSLSVRSLYLQLGGHWRQHKQTIFTLAHASLAMICATVVLTLASRVVQLAYVNHSDFPEGPYVYEAIYLNPQPVGYLGNIFSVMADFLTMGIQVWRLWVIWSAGPYAIAVSILPILVFLSFAATDVMPIVWMFYPDLVSAKTASAVFIANLSLQAVFTVSVTALIAARLMLVRRRHIRIMGTTESSKQYMNIVTMLVESYALESAWDFVLLVLFLVESQMTALFFRCDSSIKIISYLLVVYRVSTGRAWGKKTERQISSLRWNHAGRSTTTENVTRASQVLDTNALPVSHQMA
ncbi:hypothetical protein P691DRAFT_671958 [Macrolepiota fuliginosa MF-IS2]|uniref:Uncharacterized protein n=1 Tax=Macrolepiota fuliginosa MF-IS2 TaxID=1400762 RepID=A0A9P5XBG5_9AGAR|nr:hypothetical protein P691DRAFT_671958 [Macrolepiota fuliginosa MF-IS2]